MELCSTAATPSVCSACERFYRNGSTLRLLPRSLQAVYTSSFWISSSTSPFSALFLLSSAVASARFILEAVFRSFVLDRNSPMDVSHVSLLFHLYSFGIICGVFILLINRKASDHA
jgi:hypothetical protein